MSDVAAEFESYANSDLDQNASEFRSMDEIDDYLVLADEFGVDLDLDALAKARSEVEDYLRAEDHFAEEQYERRSGDDRPREREEDLIIGELFGRLAE